MVTTISTRQAACELDVPYHTLRYLVRSGKISPPKDGETNKFTWRKSDLNSARRIISKRSLTPQFSS